MDGFFSESELFVKSPPSLLPACGVCKLFEQCNSPKMPVSGEGRRKILVLGEGPGRNEDIQGKQFVGESGRFLVDKFARCGVDFRRDCWVTNSVICRPTRKDEKGQVRNRKPTDKEISYCRPNLIQTINELQPEIIIPLGSVAVKSLIGWLWKGDVGSIERWLGWKIPCQKLNAWITPNWHPAAIGYEEKNKEVMEKLFEKHLSRALKLKGRPFKKVPDYLSQVQCIYDPDEAAEAIRKITKDNPSLVAFDYETNCLKSDSDVAKIVSCSLSDGETTIAYPWVGEATKATKEFFVSDVAKVAANAKFEIRWTRSKLGVWIKNIVFDTMQAAHILDNRKAITSVKFQAFVLLGQPSYNDHIEPFLEAPRKLGGNAINRIDDINLRQLLVYNGLDSLLEILIARKQMKKLGVFYE